MKAVQFFYILSLAVRISSIIFFSFFTAPTLFKVLSKEKAGEVVGIILPKYYTIGYFWGILSIISFLIGSGMVIDARFFLLTVIPRCTLFTGIVVGPKARNLKVEIKSQNDPHKKIALKSKFDKLHALSVRLNGAVLIFGLGLLWINSGRLKI